MHDLQPLLVPVHQAFTHSQGPLLSAAGQTLELHCGAATRHEPSAWQGRARLRKHAGRETGERGTGRHVELALQPLKLIVRLRQPALQRGRRRRRAGRRPHSLLGQPPEVAAERGRARGVRHQRQLRDAHACGGAASARARAAAPNRAPHPLAGFQCVQCAASRGGAVRGASAAQPVQAARPHRKLPGSTWPTRAARRRRAAHPLPASGHAVGEGALMCALCGARQQAFRIAWRSKPACRTAVSRCWSWTASAWPTATLPGRGAHAECTDIPGPPQPRSPLQHSA